MHDFERTRIADLGAWTINGTNNLFFSPGTKIRAKKLIINYTTANNSAGSTVTVKRRPLADVAANEESLFTVLTTATMAAGSTDLVDLADPTDTAVAVTGAPGISGQKTQAADTENYPIIWPGQDIGFYSDGGGTAGVANAYLEYIELPFLAEEVEANTTFTVNVLSCSSA